MRPIAALCLSLSLFLLASPAADAAGGDAALRDVIDREWAFRSGQFPHLPGPDGARRAPDRLGDVSPAAQRQRLRAWRGFREELQAIDPAGLSAAARIDRTILLGQLDGNIADIELKGWQMPMNSDSSFFGNVAMLPDRTAIATRADAEAWLSLLADIPRHFDQQIANLRAGLAEGRTVPKVVMAGRDAAAASHGDVARAEDSAFWGPLARLPAAWPEDQRAALQARARDLIMDGVVPAYARVAAFLRDTYIPGARETIAAHDLPDGEAWYRAQIREYTTLDLAPEAIHAIGQREVARIRAEMQAILDGLEFDGELTDFIAHLRSDPRFYADSADELLMQARDIAKRIDAELPRYFGLLPRRPYGVAPVPAAIAPFYTAGRYAGAPPGSNEPGWYWVNTHNLPARPLYNLPALTLHEAVPGHHLQAALAEEQGEQALFRRTSYISAFGEGWALYAEYLGKEMGIYRTPYEDFGRLTYEMWRAARLVVDTGMHAMGWSRQQALDFMAGHTALSEHEVTTEIDRYISWPGQALSYKLGEIRIREQRARAERELGEAFDLRAFHDTLLALGSVPLSVLDDHLDAWIAARRPAGGEDGAASP